MPLLSPPPFDPTCAVNGIRAYVRVQTPPELDPRLGVVRPGMLYGFDTAQVGGPADDLLSVTTSKQINQPGGRFALQFTPREPVAGYNWADLIPGYSLVEIWLQRYPQNPEPVLVMLGLTGARQESEDYGQAEPMRTVQVSGRELSAAIFVDQQVLYLPVPPDALTPTSPLAIDVPMTDEFGRIVSAGSTSSAGPFAGPHIALNQMLAIDPELAQIGASPVDVIDRFVRMMTVGVKTSYNPSGLPLVNFEFPDARIRDLLFFDASKAQALLFDPHAQLPASSQLTDSAVSLWNLVSTWSDPHYQELWGITRDRTLDRNSALLTTTQRSAVEIIFRKKPFGGFINAAGELVGARSVSGSQFDREFENDPTQNVTISDHDVISMSVMRTVDAVRNVFLVYPQMPHINRPEDFRSQHAPLADQDPASPSNVRRFGPRLMQVNDRYLRFPESQSVPAPQPPDAYAIATSHEQLLRAWHKFEPLFYRGRYTLKGDATINIGVRATHVGRRISREYYTTGITQAMIIGAPTPTFTTVVEMERGWPIS